MHVIRTDVAASDLGSSLIMLYLHSVMHKRMCWLSSLHISHNNEQVGAYFLCSSSCGTLKLPHQDKAAHPCAVADVCCTGAISDALQVQKLASVVHELQTPLQTWRCPVPAQPC